MKSDNALIEDNKQFIKQFHNGMTRIIILWIISRNKIHGYGISLELNNFFNVFRKNDESSSKIFNPAKIYPILKKMEENGIVESEEGISNNKQVKYYKITGSGIELLENIKKKWFTLIHDDLWIEFFNDMTNYDSKVMKNNEIRD